jgi:hypothetical protein
VRKLLVSITVALVLVPNVGSPQTPQLPAGAPVIYQGVAYFPTGPTVFFDGAIMVPVGSYAGLPLYVDPTIDPVRVLYVPVGGKLMRPFVWRPSEVEAGLVYPPPREYPELAFDDPPPFYTPETTPGPFARRVIGPSVMLSGGVPVPLGPKGRGLWIEFGGRMWTPSGPGPERGPRLKVIGDHFGFPVFQEPGRRDRIFIPSTDGGPLTSYDLRPE